MESSAERSHVSSSMDSAGGKIERQLFIPFLEKLLDTNEIEGLQWLSKDKRIFRMPWKHMKRHDYDLERDSRLFKAWAVNSGKFKESEQDPSRWKINFRSALNTMKHVLVEEESSDEDCRVFRIVEPPSAQQRKRRSSEMLAMDGFGVSAYGNAPPAKTCPMKTDAHNRPANSHTPLAGVQQLPWQPPQYVYPPPVPVAAAGPAQPIAYFTTAAAPTVDGAQSTTGATYYVQNPASQQPVTQPQYQATPAGATLLAGQYAPTAAGPHVAQYSGFVQAAPAPTNGTPAANGVILRPPSHQVPVHPNGHAMMPVRNDQMVHMLSPQSLKTNNSCESLASAQSTTVAPSITAITATTTSSASSLEPQQSSPTSHVDQPHPHPVSDLADHRSLRVGKANQPTVSSHGNSCRTRVSSKASKKTQKFFADSMPLPAGSVSSKKHTVSGKAEGKKQQLSQVSSANSISADAGRGEEEEDAIIDVVSCASHDHSQADRHAAHVKLEQDAGHKLAEDSPDQQATAVRQQKQREADISALQIKVEESKRHVEHLEGSLAERNARIVQMEMQREQLNVCLHREWLIVKDLVSLVTANKTQMEEHSLQLSQLRSTSSGTLASKKGK